MFTKCSPTAYYILDDPQMFAKMFMKEYKQDQYDIVQMDQKISAKMFAKNVYKLQNNR